MSNKLVEDPIEPETTTGLGQCSAGFSIYFINHYMLLEEFKIPMWCPGGVEHTKKEVQGPVTKNNMPIK